MGQRKEDTDVATQEGEQEKVQSGAGKASREDFGEKGKHLRRGTMRSGETV